MTAKQYLKQAYRLNELINSDLKMLEELREISTRINSVDTTKERIQTSGSYDKVGDIVSKIIDLETEINNEIYKYVNIKNEIRDKINIVENKDYRLILQKRYLNFEKWEQIAVDMGYSYFHVTSRLHNKAIDSFSKIKNI